MLRTLTADDKTLIAMALLNADVKARIRVIRNGLRIVFDGSWASVAIALNNLGYRHANGQAFDRFSFEGNQVFVRYAA